MIPKSVPYLRPKHITQTITQLSQIQMWARKYLTKEIITKSMKQAKKFNHLIAGKMQEKQSKDKFRSILYPRFFHYKTENPLITMKPKHILVCPPKPISSSPTWLLPWFASLPLSFQLITSIIRNPFESSLILFSICKVY